MLKARRTASVWLVNLSLYQTADQMVFLLCLLSCHCCSNLSAQIRYASNKMHRFQWLLFFSYHCGHYHKIQRKGRIITRRQHMKPYTVLPVIAHAFIRQTKHKHGHCYKTKISPYLVTCPPNKDVDLCPFLK